MLCKLCEKDHKFKGEFVEWHNGVVTVKMWSPCAPDDAFNRRLSSERVPMNEWFSVEAFDVEPDEYFSIEAAQA